MRDAERVRGVHGDQMVEYMYYIMRFYLIVAPISRINFFCLRLLFIWIYISLKFICGRSPIALKY